MKLLAPIRTNAAHRALLIYQDLGHAALGHDLAAELLHALSHGLGKGVPASGERVGALHEGVGHERVEPHGCAAGLDAVQRAVAAQDRLEAGIRGQAVDKARERRAHPTVGVAEILLGT